MRSIRFIGAPALGLLCAFHASADTLYSYDDGIANVNIGPPGSFGDVDTDMMFGNLYEAEPGGMFINQIQLEIGSLTAGVAATICIWNDPNDDFVPDDLQLLHSFDVIPNETTFGEANIYDIAPVEVTGSFFIGAIIDVEPGEDAPARVDTDARADRSWLLYSPDMDPSDPWGSSLFQTRMDNPAFIPFPGAFAIRAVGVPAPAAGLMVLGSAAALRRRR